MIVMDDIVSMISTLVKTNSWVSHLIMDGFVDRFQIGWEDIYEVEDRAAGVTSCLPTLAKPDSMEERLAQLDPSEQHGNDSNN